MKKITFCPCPKETLPLAIISRCQNHLVSYHSHFDYWGSSCPELFQGIMTVYDGNDLVPKATGQYPQSVPRKGCNHRQRGPGQFSLHSGGGAKIHSYKCKILFYPNTSYKNILYKNIDKAHHCKWIIQFVKDQSDLTTVFFGVI